ncbi:MAG: high frequency lysogenization protein HflD [Gammaproteobacteria bacterium]|nr:high frequency lysogenization protein HflD [Gammaproteobacteria bacterium]
MRSDRDKAIALAGVFQAADLAAQIAHRGMAESEAMEASIHSLFQIDAASVVAVYGGAAGVAHGLKTLSQQLAGITGRKIETTRYVISLLHLERKLKSDRAMQSLIGGRIEENQPRLLHYPLLHANILAGLAAIYTDSISNLKPRIMVQGNPMHLQNQDNIDKIRALLLAGIRSAMLWRQCGGGRFSILFGRKRLLATTRELLDEIGQTALPGQTR